MSTTSLPESPDPGLCASCRHARRIHSAHGSIFFLCQRAAVDPKFTRYPVLPVRTCPGHESAEVS